MPNRSKAVFRLKQAYTGSEQDHRDPAFVASTESELVRRAAQSLSTILITGETGVGKGYLARWIHEHSARCDCPFIPVNCGAIPDSLIDSQLFGHARGAFTGAHTDHLGLIRAADRGTLLLDEVNELPLSAQMRLLRLLQDREVQPVGRSHPVIVDVRVIAATSIDLQTAVAQGRFRQDLLFRLDVIRLYVKPLRERRDELPSLLATFNQEIAALYRQPHLEFEPAALSALTSYHWPGNVRQLRSLVERLHVLAHGEPITMARLLELGQLNPTPSARASGSGRADLDRIKLDQVRRIVDDCGGSIAQAADHLGVHRSTLYRWLRDG